MRRNYLVLVVLTSLCAISTPAQSEVLNSETTMVLVKTITGAISPKSVKSSGTGLISAHNMMYNHSVTLYDSHSFELLKTVPDSIQLSKFGYSKYQGNYLGAPVEGSFSPDGKYLYVTNYAMYGKGFSHEGHDICSPASNYDTSFLYRIDLSSYTIDAVYPVGSVPKVVEVTPDNKYILVSNWCSYDLRIISVERQKTIKTIKIGPYPRGIAISSDSKTAFVAEMGGNRIHVINLDDFSISYIPIGRNPRAVILSPDNSMMYVSMSASGQVASWDLMNHKKGKTVTTGKAARSLTISNDGSALFVVNFEDDTVTKLRTSDMKILQTIRTCNEPIGIAFDAPTQRTWVACYGGAIKVFDNI